MLAFGAVSEFAYVDAEPTWSNAYLWPALLKVLAGIDPAERRVFELGCGNGATARLLARNGYSVTGVDPSASGIAIAKKFESERLHFEVGATSDDLGGRFGTFPLVVSLEVIEHCPSAREFMRAFTSVLAPGGVGILSTPSHSYLKNLAVVASGRFDHHFDPLWEGGHLKFFSTAKLRQLSDEFELRCELHRIGRIPVLAKSLLAVVRRN
ncbi:MAG TPA: class I SAM-dependent methyltransferase [Thermoanaerobaculia bacterium]|jgi:2-polyprenyl-6-hydroxyphenyl methylase/3-demethylubiquinone-9 3-methyltransferase